MAFFRTGATDTFNLADPDFLLDPAPMLQTMRAKGALVPVKLPILGRMWVTTTHAATAQVAKDKDHFFLTGHGAGLSNKRGIALPWWSPPTLRAIANNMLGKDDPEHRRLRKLVDKAFARRGIRNMRAGIAGQAVASAAMLGQGQVDIVPGFSRRFPLEVIADLLGVPAQDRDRFAHFGGSLGDITSALSILRIIRNMSRLRGDLKVMINKMRTDPQPGLIAELLAVEEDGDSLTQEELLAMVFLLLFAGFETTTNLISGAILALEQHPDQKRWLFADFDARIETATEELCRFVSAVGATKPRLAAVDTLVDGAQIRRGEKVMALPIAANFDPALFDQPETLQLDRFPNPHLAFSTGAHFCLGMQLARVELQEALRALYTRFPDLRLVDAVPHYARRPGHRALLSLRIDLH